MAFVPLDRSVVGIYTCELHVFAEVVSAVHAEETRSAGYAWLDGHAVTGCESGYAGPALQDDAGGFVAEDAVTFYHERADSPVAPEVDV